uniref:Uncharacterized protein n=1 Tax=Mus musculus TaxID=10090 RepID=Q3U0B1_MOUSE|nr:unnamed protein product [Mus musculus]
MLYPYLCCAHFLDHALPCSRLCFLVFFVCLFCFVFSASCPSSYSLFLYLCRLVGVEGKYLGTKEFIHISTEHSSHAFSFKRKRHLKYACILVLTLGSNCYC